MSIPENVQKMRDREVARKARLAAFVQAAKDVCCYCGGRSYPLKREFHDVHGPNAAGNYTHLTVGGKDRLCTASALWSRIAFEDVHGRPPEVPEVEVIG